MGKLQQDVSRGISSFLPLVVVVVVAVTLFLPSMPALGNTIHTSITEPTDATPAGCLKIPANFSSPKVLSRTAPASLWKGWAYGSAITLHAAPQSALVDQSVSIRVNGLKPGEPVTLRSSMKDYRNLTWTAQATFIADSHGAVDVAHDAPRYGSYSGVHAMGLIWSMLPENVKKPQQTLYSPSLHQASYLLRVEVLANTRVLAHITLTRIFRAPDVTKSLVNAKGLIGVLYVPTTPGPHPGIVVLGGSEGGWLSSSPEAALLASHGYETLALAYFQGYQSFDPRLASLPRMLTDIPLEYFVKGADWLKQQPDVDTKHVAIIGWSKGAEAALITAATFPKEFQAIITFMPSSIVWAGIQYGPGPATSSWTLDGKPLPWANMVINPAMFSSGKPLAFLDSYKTGLKNTAAVKKAAIPVEKIAGPILMISATDDQVWPSSLMAQQIMRRLAAHHHAYADKSLCYAGAGHDIQAPYRPTNASVVTVPGGSFAFGGNPAAYAYADRDAWNKILIFLHRSFE